jgi:hypothetical protein
MKSAQSGSTYPFGHACLGAAFVNGPPLMPFPLFTILIQSIIDCVKFLIIVTCNKTTPFFLNRSYLSNTSLTAVATNTALGLDHVKGHVIVSLANGRRLAVIAVTDHHNAGLASSAYTTTSYRQAVSAELHKLQYLDNGPPDVVVCIINGLDIDRDGAKPTRSCENGGLGDGGSRKVEVLQFAEETIGVAIFLVAGVPGLAKAGQYVTSHGDLFSSSVF